MRAATGEFRRVPGSSGEPRKYTTEVRCAHSSTSTGSMSYCSRQWWRHGARPGVWSSVTYLQSSSTVEPVSCFEDLGKWLIYHLHSPIRNTIILSYAHANSSAWLFLQSFTATDAGVHRLYRRHKHFKLINCIMPSNLVEKQKNVFFSFLLNSFGKCNSFLL